MSFKRHRTQSEASSSSSLTTEPTSKAQRTTDASSTAHPLLCTLPPTCNHHPTPIANSKDLEAHYATYHAHVCEEQGCNCVFPDARLLEIHQTECHDPLAAVRKDRGEKIFACHLASCSKMFLTPKARRLHLINGHGYPKEYFFAVTNKGVGGLLKRWGDGASLMRGQWKARESPDTSEPPEPQSPSVLVEEDDDEDDDMPTTSHQQPPTTGGGIDSLTDSLNALALVPPSIRFGRGGKNGGFSNEQQQPRGGRSHRGRGGHRNDNDEMDVDVPRANGRGRGRGAAAARGNADPSGGQGQRNGRGGAHGPSNAPSDPDVLAYVPRGVRARGMLHVRGGARGRGV
ncbi:hypothetical protein DFH08DRAFT_490648 [Mycena albidolilacea]|uniref:C2H2-type domain-containing protein n=1 Tax=Mycena albidolilacea TaxID=1033008 RepID=A0AAD6Z5K9_9AGAR|nr:hypothetical protein DFH08DRAFT_490648 [Mycena albidolilacea]